MPKPRASAARPARATAHSRTVTAAAHRAAPKTSRTRIRPGDAALRAHPVPSTFEQGVTAMQRHDFAAAAEHFRATAADGVDAEVRERAAVYLLACERQLSRPPRLHSPEEQLYAATLAYNRGALEDAERLLVEMTAAAPTHDFAFFMLAIVRTARGALTEALTVLHRAVRLNDENRLRALGEPDLAPLRQTDAFRKAFGRARRSGR